MGFNTDACMMPNCEKAGETILKKNTFSKNGYGACMMPDSGKAGKAIWKQRHFQGMCRVFVWCVVLSDLGDRGWTFLWDQSSIQHCPPPPLSESSDKSSEKSPKSLSTEDANVDV